MKKVLLSSLILLSSNCFSAYKFKAEIKTNGLDQIDTTLVADENSDVIFTNDEMSLMAILNVSQSSQDYYSGVISLYKLENFEQILISKSLIHAKYGEAKKIEFEKDGKDYGVNFSANKIKNNLKAMFQKNL